MVNTLGVYNPIFYANEALIHLEKALGMANRVHRGFENERNSFRKGETISIRRPSTFTAQDAPSTAQDLDTETVSLTLDKWKEVKFKLSDKELAFTGDRIINDHIRPAAYALADDIDQKLNALSADIPWFYDIAATGVVADLTGTRRVMFDNKVPLGGPDIHLEVNGAFEEDLLNLSAFTQHQGAGLEGVTAQMRGHLGRKFGMEIFANQNVTTRTAGALTGTAITNGALAFGDTSVTLDAGTLTGTMLKGDSFTFAGDTQRYAVTADATAAGNSITFSITPPIQTAVSDGTATTEEQTTSTGDNIAFHRNAFALVLAPLPDHGNELGARVATISDPTTGLAIRSRIWYEGDASEVRVALDVLYGVKTLDPNLACLARQTN